MKIITCIDCEEQFSGETPEKVMQEMLPHYKTKHKEVMEGLSDKTRKEWMEEFYKRWNA